MMNVACQSGWPRLDDPWKKTSERPVPSFEIHYVIS